MRTASGLGLIAVGAILAFAVQGHPSWLNIQVVGWIVMLTGAVGMAVPRRSYGWLRRRIVLRRGPGGRPVAGPVQEKRYPPYIMLNPGSDISPGSGTAGGEVVQETTESGPALSDDTATMAEPPPADPEVAGFEEDLDPNESARRAADREAALEKAKADWEAHQAEAARHGTPPPVEEVVEQYVEE